MANPINEVSHYLAQNLLQLRQNRGLSQGELAKLVGLPRSSVTYMESGSGNPSLQSLTTLASGLQVSIEELLARPRSRVHLRKAEDVPKQMKIQNAVTIWKLLPDKIPGMEIDKIEIKPQTKLGGIPHVANTKEYLYCIKGKISVTVNQDTYELVEGDVLAFPGDQPHVYQNASKVNCICLSVVTIAPTGI